MVHENEKIHERKAAPTAMVVVEGVRMNEKIREEATRKGA